MKYTCNRRIKSQGKRHLPGSPITLDPKDPQTERWLTDGVISAPQALAAKDDGGADSSSGKEPAAGADGKANKAGK